MASEIAEKISFSIHLPLLTKATSDSEEQTPGYMLPEIAAITFQASYCEQLGEYLLRRLSKPSYCVKLKVIKIMLHLVRTGHINFRQYLRMHDGPIKIAALYCGPPHPLLGTSPYESVRKSSQELLEILFHPELVSCDEDNSKSNNEPKTKVHLGGLGSSDKSKAKYEGFGNSPHEKEETVADKAMEMLIKLIQPSDNSTEVIKEALTSSSGEYEAVKIDAVVHKKNQNITVNENVKPKTQIKTHVPGRAGGGWESDDEEEKFPYSKQHHFVNSGSNLSMDSLERIEPVESEDESTEKKLVFQYCNLPSLPNSQLELNEACQRYATMNCIDVITAVRDLIGECLSTHAEFNETRLMRGLLIIEWFLRSDTVPTSYYSQLISPKLTQIKSSHINLKPEIKVKTEKLELIIEKLELRN